MRVVATVILLILLLTGTVVAMDIDDVLQFLAWSANTSDYNMSIDIVRQSQTVRRGNTTYTITEGNPMFAGNPEYSRTVLDLKNAFIEIAPDVLPKPWSTLALLGVVLTSGHAVANNNKILAMVGEPIQITLAYRYRW
jgi:hypothetical protein